MRNAVVLLSVVSFSVAALAQDRPERPPAPDLKSSPIAKFVGEWEGEAVQMMPGGGSHTARVHERAQWKLGGAALMIEGRGTIKDEETGKETVVHEAFGVIRYDPVTKGLRFHAFRANEPAVDSPLEILDNGDIRWSLSPAPGHTMRFTITLTSDTWVEIGEYSPDEGKTWMPMIRMNLKRIPARK